MQINDTKLARCLTLEEQDLAKIARPAKRSILDAKTSKPAIAFQKELKLARRAKPIAKKVLLGQIEYKDDEVYDSEDLAIRASFKLLLDLLRELGTVSNTFRYVIAISFTSLN